MNILGHSTKKHQKYWRERKIDWDKQYFQTWEHPHRFFITSVLNTFPWGSLMEIGVGGGANIVNILKFFKNRQLGGTDINADAIALCQTNFKGGMFKVCPADDIMMSDKSADVLLTDMMLIYVGQREIGKHIKELRRVAREYIVLCEFYEPKWWMRWYLHMKTGYNFYNWPKLLKKYGFYDIMMMKLPSSAWPGGLQEKYCYLIKARSPKRY